MTEDTPSLILEYLRRFDRRLENIELDMREVKGRLSSLDKAMWLTNRPLDRIEDRVERIEKRLDLVEH